MTPQEEVCAEIREIVRTYEAGEVDTPGGLEHMGRRLEAAGEVG